MAAICSDCFRDARHEHAELVPTRDSRLGRGRVPCRVRMCELHHRKHTLAELAQGGREGSGSPAEGGREGGRVNGGEGGGGG